MVGSGDRPHQGIHVYIGLDHRCFVPPDRRDQHLRGLPDLAGEDIGRFAPGMRPYHQEQLSAREPVHELIETRLVARFAPAEIFENRQPEAAHPGRMRHLDHQVRQAHHGYVKPLGVVVRLDRIHHVFELIGSLCRGRCGQ